MNLQLLILTIFTTWEDITNLFGQANEEVFHGYLPFIGLIIFLFILFIVLMLKFSIAVISVIMIPLIFWISFTFQLGDMIAIVGIMVAIMFGIALVKFYKR